MNLITPDDIDFSAYLRETETDQKVRSADAWLDEILDNVANPKPQAICSLPWAKTEKSFNFRAGEVTIYAGQNGGGKSLITGQIALGLIKQGHKICIASFEMKPVRTLSRMLRQFAGENIDAPRYANKLTYMSNIVRRFKDFSEQRLWFYDQQGTVKPNQIISVARYCATKLGITHIFIDSLMKCVSAEDDYNEQKYFVDELTSIARDHNVHIHLVHHIRKGNSDEAMPNKTDIKGSGAITDQVDNVFLVWRNKKKEHQVQANIYVEPLEADAMLLCEKQRNGEAEEWYSLYYNRDAQQFVEDQGAMPMAFDADGDY
jgi:twinkle protein